MKGVLPGFVRRRISRVSLALALAPAIAIGVLSSTPSAQAVSTSVVISEFRTRGPLGGNDEFVELYNLSSSAVDIGGWKLNGSNSAGTTGTRATIPAGVVLQPGCRYLLTNRTATSGYSGKVTGDATFATGISDDGGLAILTAANTIIDAAGFSAGSAYKEGTNLAPRTVNNEESYERLPAGANTQDTDDNAADFALNNGSSNPQNSASACTSTVVPTSVPTGTAVPGTATPIPPTNTPAPTNTPVPTNTPTPIPLTPIGTIQGAAHRSPLIGQRVSTSGIVTFVRSNGFYVQSATSDGNAATSDAIFVFTSSRPTVAVGSEVVVTGTVSEFRPGGSGGTNNLSTTQIGTATISVQSTGNALPAYTIIGNGGRIPPTAIISDDSNGDVETTSIFDPENDGIDFYESLESMLVQVNDAVAVGPTSSFGEIPVLGDNGANAVVRTPRGGIVVGDNYTDFNPERIILDDTFTPNAPAMSVSDRLDAPVYGIIDYSFSNFKLNVTAWPGVISGGLQREVAPAAPLGQLSIGTFNVENLDPSDGSAKFDALADQIVNNLRSPDILGLEEVQDNTGATSDGVVAANQTYQLLIDAIAAAGGPAYEYRQIDPSNNQDGGEPGGNIRVGFLFRTDRGLTFVDRAGGDATTDTNVVAGANGPELTLSPGRLSPTDPAFANSRKPLVGEFLYNGNTIFVVANHFNSKGGDQPVFGRFQPPVRSSEVQRQQQAQIVADFVRDVLALDANANVAVVGDLNDYEFSPAVTILENAGLTALIETLPKNERYTYVFEGNSQVLDHIMVSSNLLSNKSFYDVVHTNAEFADQISDHDPQVAAFDLRLAASAAKLVPMVECVVKESNDTFAGYFTYQNPNSFAVVVPIGPRNAFSPAPEDRGQPQIFQPGRTTLAEAVVANFAKKDSVTWYLDGLSATATSKTDRCAK